MSSEIQSIYGDPLGLLCRNSLNRFVYVCSKCGSELVNGSELESHVIWHDTDEEDHVDLKSLVKCEAFELPIFGGDEPDQSIGDEHGMMDDSSISNASMECEAVAVNTESDTDSQVSPKVIRRTSKRCKNVHQKSETKYGRGTSESKPPPKVKPIPKQQRPYCSICKRSITTDMEKHNNVYHSCSFCGERLENVQSRVEHYQTYHVGERRFKCTYEGCDKQYYEASRLKQHVDVEHLKLRRFLCEICGKNFGSKQTLKNHELTHGEPQVKCKFCDSKFTTKEGRRQHYKWRHKDLI